MEDLLHDRHPVTLAVSAAQVRRGASVTVLWKAVGADANVASVHLTSGPEEGPHMIESVPLQSSREVIFTHSGTFAFTLTVIFGDGVKRLRQVKVAVQA